MVIQCLTGDGLTQLAARIVANAWQDTAASFELRHSSPRPPDVRNRQRVFDIPLAGLRPNHSPPSRTSGSAIASLSRQRPKVIAGDRRDMGARKGDVQPYQDTVLVFGSPTGWSRQVRKGEPLTGASQPPAQGKVHRQHEHDDGSNGQTQDHDKDRMHAVRLAGASAQGKGRLR